jgi:hypothetical protein
MSYRNISSWTEGQGDSRRSNIDYLRVGLKGTHLSKTKWIEKDKVRGLFPCLPVD